MAHQEFGVRLLERVRDDLEAYAMVEQFPRMEGRQMVMVLSPKKKEVITPKAKEVKSKENNQKTTDGFGNTKQSTISLESNLKEGTKTTAEKF
jgi:translation initiation factor IF-3